MPFFSFSFQITMKGNKLAFFLLLVLAFEILFFTATEANPFWSRRRRRRRCSSSRPAGVAWVNGWQQYFSANCRNSKRQFNNLLVLFLLLISSKQRKEHFNWKRKISILHFFCFVSCMPWVSKLNYLYLTLGERWRGAWRAIPIMSAMNGLHKSFFFFFTKSLFFYSLLFISKYHLFRGIVHFLSIRDLKSEWRLSYWACSFLWKTIWNKWTVHNVGNMKDEKPKKRSCKFNNLNNKLFNSKMTSTETLSLKNKHGYPPVYLLNILYADSLW